MKDNNREIPQNATIRQEFIRRPECQKSHGNYFYAYWKEHKELSKRYVGKNLEDFRLRKIASCSHTFFPTNSRDYFNQFGRLIPYHFINQVTCCLQSDWSRNTRCSNIANRQDMKLQAFPTTTEN